MKKYALFIAVMSAPSVHGFWNWFQYDQNSSSGWHRENPGIRGKRAWVFTHSVHADRGFWHKKLTIFGGEKSTITSLDGIEKLQTLTYLDIIDQNIHNISSVKSLNNLTWLGLTKLNDSDLVGNCSVDSPIYSLDKLEQLFVSSSISDDTIKQLKVHLPNCEIIRVA